MKNVFLLLFCAISLISTFKVQAEIICKQYGTVALVNENEPVDFVVFTPSCTDTAGGTVSYSITDGRPKKPYKKKFKIDDNGNIKIKATLNADFIHKFLINIGVTSTSGASDTIELAVKILDYNDNQPVLKDLPPTLTLSEDKAIGYKISSCRVSDRDKPDVHQLAIINQESEDSLWYLDKENCDLYLNGELDYETKTSYTITIHAVDSGIPHKTSNPETMVIRVTDVNDNYPVCPQYYKVFNIRLDQTIGVNIGGVVCSDIDSGVNGEIKYALSASNSVEIKEKFQVDAITGDISLKSQLDQDSLTSREVKIDVADSGTDIALTSSVVYCIVITDAGSPRTSTDSPTTSTDSPTTSTVSPTTSTVRPTTSTDRPTTSTVSPTTSTDRPTTSTVSPTTSTVRPTTSTVRPTTSTFRPETSSVRSMTFPTITPLPNVSGNPIVSDQPNVSQQPDVTEQPMVGDKPNANTGGGSQFVKGLGAGIGSTLAVAIISILVIVVIYKCRNRGYIQSNPVLYAAKAMKIVSGVGYEEFKC